MIDPELVIDGIHHCATDGKTCGDCPIIAYCDYGNLEPEIIKTIDSMLFHQQEAKNHILKEVEACFDEMLDRFIKEHPERIAKPVIEVKIVP